MAFSYFLLVYLEPERNFLFFCSNHSVPFAVLHVIFSIFCFMLANRLQIMELCMQAMRQS